MKSKPLIRSIGIRGALVVASVALVGCDGPQTQPGPPLVQAPAATPEVSAEPCLSAEDGDRFGLEAETLQEPCESLGEDDDEDEFDEDEFFDDEFFEDGFAQDGAVPDDDTGESLVVTGEDSDVDDAAADLPEENDGKAPDLLSLLNEYAREGLDETELDAVFDALLRDPTLTRMDKLDLLWELLMQFDSGGEAFLYLLGILERAAPIELVDRLIDEFETAVDLELRLDLLRVMATAVEDTADDHAGLAAEMALDEQVFAAMAQQARERFGEFALQLLDTAQDEALYLAALAGVALVAAPQEGVPRLIEALLETPDAAVRARIADLAIDYAFDRAQEQPGPIGLLLDEAGRLPADLRILFDRRLERFLDAKPVAENLGGGSSVSDLATLDLLDEYRREAR